MKRLLSLFMILPLVFLPMLINTSAAGFNDLAVCKVPTSSYYPADLHETLSRLCFGLKADRFSQAQLKTELLTAIDQMQQLSLFGDYWNETHIEESGKTYGADLTVQNGIYTTGDYVVTDDNTLVSALNEADSGDVVFVTADADIDLSELRAAEGVCLSVSEGVILAGDRGYNGSTGGKLKFSYYDNTLIKLLAGSMLTGLCIQGPDASEHTDYETYIKTEGIIAEGSDITVSNCEISGFNTSGITVKSGGGHLIESNYIHHIKGYAAGNAVYIENSSSVEIKNNLFSNVRTAVNCISPELLSISIMNNVDAGNTLSNIIDINCDPANIEIKYNTFFNDEEITLGEDKMPGTIISNNIMKYPAGDNMDMTFKPKDKGPAAVFSDIVSPDITSRIFFGDYKVVFDVLSAAYDKACGGDTALYSDAVQAISAYGGYDNFYEYKDSLSIQIDNKLYGAYTTEGADPLGGGAGSTKYVYTQGDYNVTTCEELVAALKTARSGEVVFIHGDAAIDITPLMIKNETLIVGEGVTLAGNRGEIRDDGSVSAGPVIVSQRVLPGVYIYAMKGSVISGLSLKGLDSTLRLQHYNRSFRGENPPGHSYYYKLKPSQGINVAGDNVEISNCEIAGFSHAGILLSKDTKNSYIHNSYIHHNQYNGLGYGICHDNGSESVMEYNIFMQNRHSIAGTGAPGTGYVARYNLDFHSSNGSHRFDMHGGSDRGDGTDIAGDYVEMYNNTFLGNGEPYHKRGVPVEYSRFYSNIVVSKLSDQSIEALIGENLGYNDNIWGYGIYHKCLDHEVFGCLTQDLVKGIIKFSIFWSDFIVSPINFYLDFVVRLSHIL